MIGKTGADWDTIVQMMHVSGHTTQKTFMDYIKLSSDEIADDIDTIANGSKSEVLFGTKVPAISKHLKNIFESGELDRAATISKMEKVVNCGFRGASVEVVGHYNLDVILSVGYRVNSRNATALLQNVGNECEHALGIYNDEVSPKGRHGSGPTPEKAIGAPHMHSYTELYLTRT